MASLDDVMAELVRFAQRLSRVRTVAICHRGARSIQIPTFATPLGVTVIKTEGFKPSRSAGASLADRVMHVHRDLILKLDRCAKVTGHDIERHPPARAPQQSLSVFKHHSGPFGPSIRGE